MTEYRIVPVEPTEAMMNAGMENYGWPTFGGAGGCYAEMLAAAPSAADDPAFVERVAVALCLDDLPNNDPYGEDYDGNVLWTRFDESARAAIRAMGVSPQRTNGQSE